MTYAPSIKPPMRAEFKRKWDAVGTRLAEEADAFAELLAQNAELRAENARLHKALEPVIAAAEQAIRTPDWLHEMLAKGSPDWLREMLEKGSEE